MNLFAIPVCLALLSAVPSPAAVEDEALKQLQGTWSMEITRPDGEKYRVEKEVKDNKETVRVRSQDGGLQHEHVVEFKLERQGDVRIFRWSKGSVTAGPNAGNPMADGVYIYTIRDGRWICAHGLLANDQAALSVEVFQRAKESVK